MKFALNVVVGLLCLAGISLIVSGGMIIYGRSTTEAMLGEAENYYKDNYDRYYDEKTRHLSSLSLIIGSLCVSIGICCLGTACFGFNKTIDHQKYEKLKVFDIGNENKEIKKAKDPEHQLSVRTDRVATADQANISLQPPPQLPQAPPRLPQPPPQLPLPPPQLPRAPPQLPQPPPQLPPASPRGDQMLPTPIYPQGTAPQPNKLVPVPVWVIGGRPENAAATKGRHHDTPYWHLQEMVDLDRMHRRRRDGYDLKERPKIVDKNCNPDIGPSTRPEITEPFIEKVDRENFFPDGSSSSSSSHSQSSSGNFIGPGSTLFQSYLPSVVDTSTILEARTKNFKGYKFAQDSATQPTAMKVENNRTGVRAKSRNNNGRKSGRTERYHCITKEQTVELEKKSNVDQAIFAAQREDFMNKIKKGDLLIF